MNKRQSQKVTMTCATLGSAFVLWRLYRRWSIKQQIESDLKVILVQYTTKMKDPSTTPDEKKQLTQNCLKSVFGMPYSEGLDVLYDIFAIPKDTEIGGLVLETYNFWNGSVYDNISEKIIELLPKQTLSPSSSSSGHHSGIRVLEIGYGGGIGIEFMAQKLDKLNRLGYVHGFEVSKRSVTTMNEKFSNYVKENKMEFCLANIGNENDKNVAKKIKNGIKYDFVYHSNSFYYWGDLYNCGKVLDQLIESGGYIVGGFNWKPVQRNSKNAPKSWKMHIYQDDYMTMLKNAKCFDVDNAVIIDGFAGNPMMQLIICQKK